MNNDYNDELKKLNAEFKEKKAKIENKRNKEAFKKLEYLQQGINKRNLGIVLADSSNEELDKWLNTLAKCIIYYQQAQKVKKPDNNNTETSTDNTPF